MPAAITSINVYRANRQLFGKQAASVFAWVALNPRCSRKEIARGLNMETSTVSARCNELLATGQIEVDGTKECSVSGMNVEALRVAPIQKSLFAA